MWIVTLFIIIKYYWDPDFKYWFLPQVNWLCWYPAALSAQYSMQFYSEFFLQVHSFAILFDRSKTRNQTVPSIYSPIWSSQTDCMKSCWLFLVRLSHHTLARYNSSFVSYCCQNCSKEFDGLLWRNLICFQEFAGFCWRG